MRIYLKHYIYIDIDFLLILPPSEIGVVYRLIEHSWIYKLGIKIYIVSNAMPARIDPMQEVVEAKPNSLYIVVLYILR